MYIITCGFLFNSCKHEPPILILKDKKTTSIDTAKISFSKNLVPILQLHCSSPPYNSCHSWATKHSAVKIYVDNGRIQDRVFDKRNMPELNNIDGAPPLTSIEIAMFKQWISEGSLNN